MLISSKITSDTQGNIYLDNKYSAKNVLDLARVSRESGGTGWFGDKNGECKLIGYIPEDMWTISPWLIEARRAQFAGDRGKAHYYIMKFFELYPNFKGANRQRYWRGHRAVLL